MNKTMSVKELVETVKETLSDVAGKMAGLSADLADDIQDGSIDILDCMLIFWIALTACVVIGVSWWDFNRKKNQQPGDRTRDGALRIGDHRGAAAGVHAGAGREGAGSLAGQGESCRWVNSVVAWLYLHQSQAPGHIVLSWLKALNEHTKKRGVSVSNVINNDC